MSGCRRCGAALGSQGRGRPAVYCSPACRRAAEFEVRRLTRRLDALEVQASTARVQLAMPERGGRPYGVTDELLEGRVAALSAESANVEERLRELLAAQDGDA